MGEDQEELVLAVEVVAFGMKGLITELILEVVPVDSELAQFQVQVVFTPAHEVVVSADDVTSGVMVGEEEGEGVGEGVGDPDHPVKEPVQEPFHDPVHGPAHVGEDVFIAEMTVKMLDVIFCITVMVVTAPSTVVNAVVVVAW